MKLKDMVAIVTGAGRGIGRAIAETLAKEGAKLAVVEVSNQRAKEAAEQINNAGGQAIAISVDVANGDEVIRGVETVLSHYDKVDLLVNNAGTGTMEHFIEGDEKRWARIIAVNLTGLITLTRAVLGGMLERKYGKIINIASNAGLFPCAFEAVYSASKGGVVAFTRSLAAEVAKDHINVNVICPGVIGTTMLLKARDFLSGEILENYEKMLTDIPWGRMGLPQDIANLALFLASDESDYITGQCISVDGGASHYPDA